MHEELIGRLEAATGEDNKLDVLCEIALFQPDGADKSIRANVAGTKVIVTHTNGKEVTYWAEPWSNPHRKDDTIAALRAHAVREGENNAQR